MRGQNQNEYNWRCVSLLLKSPELLNSIVEKCLQFHAHCIPLSSHIKITIVIILYFYLETNNFHKYSHSWEFRFIISIIIQAVVCLRSHGYLHAELRVEHGASISKSSPLFCAATICQDTRVLTTSSRTKKKKNPAGRVCSFLLKKVLWRKMFHYYTNHFP